MKHFYYCLFLICLYFLTFPALANDSIPQNEVQLKIQILEIKNQQLESEQALYLTAKQERTELINLFKWIGGIAVAFLVFGGCATWVDARRSRTALVRNMNSSFNRKLEELKTDTLAKFAESLNVDPENLKKMLQQEVHDTRLKEASKIHFIGDQTKFTQIERQLEKWGIPTTNISKGTTSATELDNLTLQTDAILFVVDTPTKEYATASISATKKQKAVFYLGEGFFNPKLGEFQNFAKTETTIYQNLMDLIRYIDFKK